ncbi:C-3 sterol dehydrogenase/C-4 decarboxylase-like protein [Cucurbitaria berberidis CBS 394.84]|uniref:C-3 sterol dehydrogenase/C-4 decarboxylase-like protein n=1 Tax=Cucurbitaria berberidis CBS 394.84 TaxID=1168544 RepID=A0A9P4GHI3_9PLEO|nr:C-3 sterol dehydrogenase/C-4 decarboxylase-like protein [Cucurbitaria berberidis CBS 394.84]KAF1845564.1 C-3 sterol dehydrogenase/C-4 decarboxylase-like protein [Cucurbitaria berberidis CBS 394.84]
MEQIRVLITGGCGFLGTAVVSALLETKRFEVTVIDINPPSLGSTTFANDVRYVRANVLDAEALQKVFSEARPAVVIHTVGVYPLGMRRYSMKGKEPVFRVNVEGTRNVLQAAKECGAKGFVYTSSITVVLDELDKDFRSVDEEWPTGRAHTSYGLSKAIAEELVLSANTHDFATCALRSAPIFGPNDAACIPTIHSCIAAGQTPFILGTGTNLQDFVYVDNVADAHVLAVANLINSQTAAGEAMFITNGEPVTARDLCIAVWKEFGHVPKFQMRIPETLAWWMGYAAEWTSWLSGTEGVLLSRGMVSDGCRERYVSISKARQILGYKPRVSLEEGLKISCQHYQKKISQRSKR